MTTRVTNEVVVYRARNNVNGHIYIGVTKRGLPRREHEHRYSARKGSSFLLHKALRKYGDEAFDFSVVANFNDDYELAMLFEAELVDKEQPAYNLVPGGLNRTGAISAITTQRMRVSHLGKGTSRKGGSLSPEHVAKLRGQLRSPEARLKMSLARRAFLQAGGPTTKGLKHTEEAKEKMAAAHRGKPGPWRGKKRPDLGAKIRATRLLNKEALKLL